MPETKKRKKARTRKISATMREWQRQVSRMPTMQRMFAVTFKEGQSARWIARVYRVPISIVETALRKHLSVPRGYRG